LIFHAYQQNAHEYLKLLEQAQIPFITYSKFNEPIYTAKNKLIDIDQNNYKYWLSEHHVENKQGAALLLHRLIEQAKKAKKYNKYRAKGFSI
jgi:hypothetical protein